MNSKVNKTNSQSVLESPEIIDSTKLMKMLTRCLDLRWSLINMMQSLSKSTLIFSASQTNSEFSLALRKHGQMKKIATKKLLSMTLLMMFNLSRRSSKTKLTTQNVRSLLKNLIFHQRTL